MYLCMCAGMDACVFKCVRRHKPVTLVRLYSSHRKFPGDNMGLKGLDMTITIKLRFSKPALPHSLLSFFHFFIPSITPSNYLLYVSAEEASGGQRLEEECGGHVRDGGKEEDV